MLERGSYNYGSMWACWQGPTFGADFKVSLCHIFWFMTSFWFVCLFLCPSFLCSFLFISFVHIIALTVLLCTYQPTFSNLTVSWATLAEIGFWANSVVYSQQMCTVEVMGGLPFICLWVGWFWRFRCWCTVWIAGFKRAVMVLMVFWIQSVTSTC